MATRIIRMTGSGFTTGGGTLSDEDGNLVIQPPNNVKWTLVEVRIAMSGAGYAHGFFNTEKYHSFDQSIDFGQNKVPHTVVVDIVRPNNYSIDVFAASGTINAVAELVIEESPVTATPAGG